LTSVEEFVKFSIQRTLTINEINIQGASHGEKTDKDKGSENFDKKGI
jgi:hypothetical protein